MKTLPYQPARQRNTGSLLISLLVSVIALALLLSLTSCQATGFTRAVPVSIAQQGTGAIWRYRILEVPETWAPDINPLFEPGESENLWDPAERKALTERLHRKNIRLVTENLGYGLYEDMQEDWNPPEL